MIIVVRAVGAIRAWLKRKTAEVADRSAIGALILDARAFAPRYSKIKYPKYKDDGLLYEIDMADLHFGKLAWAQETGQDYDIDIAATIAREAVAELLNFVKQIPVSKILLPLGNDFFNVNGAGEATVNGT